MLSRIGHGCFRLSVWCRYVSFSTVLSLNFIHIEPVAETDIFRAVGLVSQFLEAFTIMAIINEDRTVKVFPACSSTAFEGCVFSKVNFS